MKKIKKNYHFLICLFSALLCCRLLFSETPVYGREILETMQSFFTGEPEEVRELRNMEVAQQEEGHLEYYFHQLSEEGQRIYRELLLGIRAYEKEIYLTSSDGTEIDHAYHAMLRDHPELFWIHTRETIYKTLYSTYGVLEAPTLYSMEEIQAGQQAIEAAWEELCTYFWEGESEYDKVHTVYAWIIQNTEYVPNPYDQSIDGVFRKQEAVCAGYAGAVQYFLERLGIPCIYAAGDSSQSSSDTPGHAWNMVQLDGEWYYIDATNGDQPAFLLAEEFEVQPVLFDYLCPFPEEYEQVCIPDEEFSTPQAWATAYNDAVRTGGFFDYYNYEDVKAYASQKIAEGYRRIRLKFSDKAAFTQACEHLIDGGGLQGISEYYMSYYGLYEVQYHYGTLEEVNTIYLMF